MKRSAAILSLILFFSSFLYSSATIPAQAWSRDIGATGFKDGAPIGGFGAGTVTWKYDGIFYKDRLKIGHVASGGNGSDAITFTDDATAAFYLYQKTTGAGTASVKKLTGAVLGTGQATYYSLFPMSWVDYTGSQFNVKATVTQFSPIIPNDYQRVSYPMGIYEWEVTNPSATQSYDASIMMTWNNDYSGVSATAVTNGNFKGIVLQGSGTGYPGYENQGEFALGSINGNGVTVTVMSAATSAAIVTDFTTDGMLPNTTGANTIGAVAFAVTLAPGETRRVPIVLSWDIPIYEVGTVAPTKKWWKEYTRYFGRTGRNAWAMAQDALTNHTSWESQIDAWQNSVLINSTYPDWLKQMVFNELYIYFTGGTVWEAGAASGQLDDPNEDMFSHLESYIYMFYGTSDVRFYGSWALFMNWPNIDKQAVKQFCDSVQNSRADRAAGTGSCAHDLGGIRAWNPGTNTCSLNGTEGNWYLFDIYDCYRWRSACDWKDLNSKLVLMVYRDWKLTGSSDSTFLNYCYYPVKAAMAKVKSQDTDGKGLPNSSGVDQTYDDMDLTGDTAYCGGLFLAACLAAKELAVAAGDTTAANTYQAWFDLAHPNYENQLWTGSYYKIDTGSTNTLRIMSDQLCGDWYAKACGLPDVVVNTRAAVALQKIYDNNFMKFDGGADGAVNVMLDNGTIDTSTVQTNECWVGTTWGVVADLIHHGMLTQAYAMGQSLQNTIWNTDQLWFRTPEAWKTGVSSQRAYYYMRGTTIWAVKWAYDHMPVIGTPTNTPTSTATRTNTPYYSPTSTMTNTPFISVTYTPTPTNTRTFTQTPVMTATPTFTITRTSTITPVVTPIRVNCAGPLYVSAATGFTWSADQPYAGNTWGYQTVGSTNDRSPHAVANTTDPTLYLTERWASGPNYLDYAFDLPPGDYEVTLKFTEQYYSAANQRQFNINIEGILEQANFDIVGEAGAAWTAIDKVYTVTLTDNQLNIHLSAGAYDVPLINAIQILKINPTPTATPSGSATNTVTPVQSPTYTVTRTNTQTSTPSQTRTSTPTPTWTATNTETSTPYLSPTETNTCMCTPSLSASPTAAFTDTCTQTPAAGPSDTPVFTETYTRTPAPTATGTSTFTQTPYYSPTITPTITLTLTGTPPTSTNTPVITMTFTFTLIPSPTLTFTSTLLPSATRTYTSTQVPSPTLTHTPTQPIPTQTYTQTQLATATATPYTDSKNLAVTIKNIYPCPYTLNAGNLNIGFEFTKAVRFYEVRIYTSGFRLVKEARYQSTPSGGLYTAVITADIMRTMANGTYFVIIEAETDSSITARSKPAIAVIIK